MILCDTNILIDIFKNKTYVSEIINNIGQHNIVISDVTLAELYYGARDRREMQMMKKTLMFLPAIHVTSDISQIAVDLVEKFCLSHKLDFQDALIAATALYYNVELFTLNLKDFRFIPDLKLYKI